MAHSMSQQQLSSHHATSTSSKMFMRSSPVTKRSGTARQPTEISNFLAAAWSKVSERQQQQQLKSSPSTPDYSVTVKEKTPKKKHPSTLSWAGSGLYFFWQLGAMKYLEEQYDLTKIPMVGASGGSIAAVLAACKVPAELVLSRAYQLSFKYNIWERPTAIVGVLSELVEEWLDDLLPANAHELCRGRVTVVVTTLPDMKQIGISDFKDKKDLIDAIMASCHVPYVLDLKASRPCRGKACVDGSLPDFFFGNCDLLTKSGGAVVFDYFDDKLLKRQGRMDMLSLTSYDDIRERMHLGYNYAKRLHEAGTFMGLHLEEVLLPAGGHVQEVMASQVERPARQEAAVGVPLGAVQQVMPNPVLG